MKNTLQNINIIKLFFALVLLGAYSASMYKLASTQVLQTRAIDMSISESTAEDEEKIRAVVKPRIEDPGPTSAYFPGVACVIDAGPQSTVEEMQEYFSTCLQVHEDFMSSSAFIE